MQGRGRSGRGRRAAAAPVVPARSVLVSVLMAWLVVSLVTTGCVAPLLEAGDPRAAAGAHRCETPAGTAPFGTASPAGVGLDAGALREAVQYATDRGAQSVRVYRHGCLVARSGHDPVSEHQRFPGWSMTKGVVATVVGRAVALGLLEVDDPIGAHLGGLAPDVAALTVGEFLHQTTGLRMAWVNDLWAAGSTDSVADVVARPFQARPGSTFQYAQTAVTVLVAVVEAAAGTDFQEFADRELFRPVGIQRHQWQWQRDTSGRTQGFAFLDMAPVAWARLGHLLLRAGMWDGRRILDAEFVAAGTRGSEANPGYGFLWWTNAGDWHVDSGFPAYRRLERPMWPGLPRDAFAYAGLFDQDVTVIPSLDMVVVRMGLPPEPFGDPLGESPGLRPRFWWRFHRLLMAAVTDADVPDPGPWQYEGDPPPVDVANLFEPTLPPFVPTGPPWLVGAVAG